MEKVENQSNLLQDKSRAANLLYAATQFLIAGAALYYLALFFILAFQRTAYPFELEWSEGALIDEMVWLLRGNALYGPPSLNFIPLAYNPLFFYISAVFSKVLGTGYLAARLVSILSVLGTLVLIYALVKDTTGQRSAGWLAAGIYAATFRLSGAWLDLAKVDSLWIFLVLAAHWSGRRQKLSNLLLSGALYALAYYTKQLTLPVLLGMAFVSLIQFRGRTWPQWAAAAVTGGLAFAWLETSSGGWYSFYTIRSLSHHARTGTIWFFWTRFVPAAWPGLAAAASALSVPLANREWISRQRPIFWQDLAFCGTLVLVSWSVFLKVWTYDNGLIPACLALALLLGWAWGFTCQAKGHLPGALLHLSIAALILLQFGWLYYVPAEQLPTQTDRQANEAFLDYVENLPGEVFIPSHGYLSVRAGKETYFHAVTYADVTVWDIQPRTPSDAEKRALAMDIWQDTSREQAVDWIILDNHPEYWYPDYVVTDEIALEPGVMEPVTGVKTRPRYLLAPNPILSQGELPVGDPLYDRQFAAGWSGPQDGMRHFTAPAAQVLVLLPQDRDMLLEASVQSACPAGAGSPHRVAVFWNSAHLGEIEVPACGSAENTLIIPAGAILQQENELTFRLAPGENLEQETDPLDLTTLRFTPLP